LALRYRVSFDNVNDFVTESNAVCDRLAFGIDAELFEQALNDVAGIIDVSSTRPEKTIGKGPDGLRMGDGSRFLIIEAKSEVDLDRDELHKSETEQLLHSWEWFTQEYKGKAGRPLSFHPATKLAREAVFPEEGRIVTSDILTAFRTSLRGYVSVVAGIERGALT